MEAVRETDARRSTAAIPTLFAVLALVLLTVAVAFALIPVRVAGHEPGMTYRCTPIGADDGTTACADRVDWRLKGATFAGAGAAVFGLLAFASERGLKRDRAA